MLAFAIKLEKVNQKREQKKQHTNPKTGLIYTSYPLIIDPKFVVVPPLH